MTRRGGFTLVELLLSLSISAMVLTAAAGVAFAVSRAWSRSDDVNEVVTHGRTGVLRIGDRLRAARAIGFTDARYMLIWREDANGDGKVNKSELTLLEFDRQAGTLSEGQLLFPADISAAAREANNEEITPDKFTSHATVNQLAGNSYYVHAPVAENVESLVWLLDADPPATRLVQMQLRLERDGLRQMLHGGFALRAPLEVK